RQMARRVGPKRNVAEGREAPARRPRAESALVHVESGSCASARRACGREGVPVRPASTSRRKGLAPRNRQTDPYAKCKRERREAVQSCYLLSSSNLNVHGAP